MQVEVITRLLSFKVHQILTKLDFFLFQAHFLQQALTLTVSFSSHGPRNYFDDGDDQTLPKQLSKFVTMQSNLDLVNGKIVNFFDL